MSELKPNFHTYSDVTLQITDVQLYFDKSLEIRTSKALLAAFSQYFEKLFSEDRSKNVIVLSVRNANLFSMLIKSFYNFNTISLILNAEVCDDKLELMFLCSKFIIPIPYREILEKIDIHYSCFDKFINLLNEISFDLNENRDLIAAKVTDKTDISILKNPELENYILYFGLDVKFACAYSDGSIMIYNLFTRKLVKVIKSSQSYVNNITFSQDNKKLISGGGDGIVRVHNSLTGEIIMMLRHETSTHDAVWSWDNKIIVSITYGKMINIWDSLTGDLITKIMPRSYILSIAISHDNKRLICGTLDKKIIIFDLLTMNIMSILEGHKDAILSIIVSSDDKIIVSGSLDSKIRIWDYETGELLKTLKGHSSGIMSVCFSSGDKEIISASIDKTIKIWDRETMELIDTLIGHKESVTTVALSPDGRILISGSADKTVKVWEFPTGKLIETLKTCDFSVNCVAFFHVMAK